MKNLSLVYILFVVGCSGIPPSELKSKNTKPSYVVKIDGCEYISLGHIDTSILAHKGNCKYCEKKRAVVEKKIDQLTADLKKLNKDLDTIIDAAEDKYGVDLR